MPLATSPGSLDEPPSLITFAAAGREHIAPIELAGTLPAAPVEKLTTMNHRLSIATLVASEGCGSHGCSRRPAVTTDHLRQLSTPADHM
jgi:hypothetical protein